MKAVRFDHYGEPTDVLTVNEQPLPEPGPGEVRLKIKFSPVNPSDLLYVRGHYSGVTEHFPSGAGFESVSIIDAVGPGVEGLSVGQRVFAHNGPGGNWSEYAVVSAQTAWPVPDDLPDGRMLLYGSLTGEGVSVGDDPRFTLLSGRRTLEVYWLGYWLPRLHKSGIFPPGRPAIQQLIDEIADLIRTGVLETSPGRRFGLDQIHAAVAEAESVGRSGKVLIAP